MAKTKEMNCSCSKAKTTWIRKSNQTTGETIFLGILTVGVAFATRSFWWKCTKCGKIIDENNE